MGQPARPDILWIVTTQWRAGAFGHAGDRNARTPNIDRLAAEGINHAQAVTPHPFGPFARAALLTGVASPGNGVRNYFDPLPPNTRTIAHELKARGYTTGYFGKWHLSARDPSLPLIGESHARLVVPPDQRGGFEFWEGFEGGFLLNDPWLHGSRIPVPRKFPGYQSDVICARLKDWLAGFATGERGPAAQVSEPWFAVVSLEAPHPPYHAPAAGIVAQDPSSIILAPNVPRGGPAEEQARRELAGYYAHIEATDRAIGRLLTLVGEEAHRRQRPAPIVVFTSVHGDMHGAHGLFRKGWPHEESVRVPFLVRFPGRANQPQSDPSTTARRIDDAMTLLELPAMTVAWADAAVERTVPGWAEISMPSVVALPQQCDRRWRGVRTPARKLVVDESGLPWLFFDLERDPWERTNLAGDPGRQREIADLRRMTGL